MRPLFLDQPRHTAPRVAQSPAEYASPLTRPRRDRTGSFFWWGMTLAAVFFTLLAMSGSLPGMGR